MSRVTSSGLLYATDATAFPFRAPQTTLLRNCCVMSIANLVYLAGHEGLTAVFPSSFTLFTVTSWFISFYSTQHPRLGKTDLFHKTAGE